jgi:hypothetical protein
MQHRQHSFRPPRTTTTTTSSSTTTTSSSSSSSSSRSSSNCKRTSLNGLPQQLQVIDYGERVACPLLKGLEMPSKLWRSNPARSQPRTQTKADACGAASMPCLLQIGRRRNGWVRAGRCPKSGREGGRMNEAGHARRRPVYKPRHDWAGGQLRPLVPTKPGRSSSSFIADARSKAHTHLQAKQLRTQRCIHRVLARQARRAAPECCSAACCATPRKNINCSRVPHPRAKLARSIICSHTCLPKPRSFCSAARLYWPPRAWCRRTR